MSTNAGGSATNAGIDFQQRISALFMTHMLMEIAFIDDLGFDGNINIEQMFFESSYSIDDLVVKTNCGTIYIQAKRSINCSNSLNSEFSKVICQFVKQFLKGNHESDRYVLVTSSKASSKIYRDLRKITENIRYNDIGFIENPLNKVEKSVFSVLINLISSHYSDISKKPITEDINLNILKKIHISVIDIEAGMPLEKAVITLISGKSKVSPNLLWDSLISLGLSLSKNRSSINKKGLEKKVGKFINEIPANERASVKSEFFKLQMKSVVSSGREVLLIKSIIDNADYMIVELIRFAEDGSKRVKFYNNKCKLLNGETWDVLRRASTYSGLERFIEANQDEYKDNRITLLPINTEENIDTDIIPRCYSELCQKNIEEKDDPFKCLHCGDPISDDRTPFIEIDVEDKEHDVGFIHADCMLPTDRILGILDAEIFRDYPYLKGFDYALWYELIQKGQGLFKGLSGTPRNIYPIAWKPDYANISRGKYCVQIDLEDGSTRYLHERGKVVRETKEAAYKTALQFNDSFEKAKGNNDPWCYTSIKEAFTTYSNALKIKQDEEECILCENAEPVIFTRSINKVYSLVTNFYTPLMILLEKSSGLPINFDGAIFLVSEPLSLDKLIHNWERTGVTLPKYTISIIETDSEFDKLVQSIKSDGFAVIINPEIDMNQTLSSGFVVENYYELISNKANNP